MIGKIGAVGVMCAIMTPPSFTLTERDMRNQCHPQPTCKRGKFKRRNRKGKS